MAHYSDTAQLSIDLVNTFDVFAGDDLLGTVRDLTDFAVAHGIEQLAATVKDLESIRRARPELRRALLAEDEAIAVVALNDLLAAAKPRPQLVHGSDEKWVFGYADPEGTVADRILAEAAGGALEEIRLHGVRRFNTCGSSTCEDVFVDRTRNRSRRFCSSDVCGNREAQRAHRARRAHE
ncbi:MAG: CGNR zinc finger domain-containing protein [Acidimicrobiia bacterium]|nr:CGNR zinc finger domain-containing protein [Acidimicrobiia bacterium]MDH4306043.1 CGNR zinc finger domain-containing protein [Acidimicrobiia bacterium]MDH5292281.1 CGNR zinc finger domain-containing protein [Acidimicrobiia bacterium]